MSRGLLLSKNSYNLSKEMRKTKSSDKIIVYLFIYVFIYHYFFKALIKDFNRPFHRGTQREYSSKPVKNSIVKRILVFKR